MAGERVPVVMLPRYSTLAGATTFVTTAMDVTNYATAILNVWRGKLALDDVDFSITCQESSDQLTWTTCAGTNASAYDPGEETEGPVSATIKKRWFRVSVVLVSNPPNNPYPQATCWAVGFLEERVT